MSEPRLLTKDDFKQLPHWARVAFASRCARRAQLLFKRRWPNALEKQVIAIEKAICVAEQSASSAHATSYASTSSAYASVAYASAAYAASLSAVYTASCAVDAVERTHRAGVPLADIYGDYTTILELARKHKWDDDTPVPPSVFGPLEEPSKGYQLEVKLQVPANWTVEQIRDYVSTLSDRVDDVHRAAGGKGLKVCDLEILDDAVVTAGVRQ